MVDEILAMADTVVDVHLDVGTGYESLNARVSNGCGRFEEFFTPFPEELNRQLISCIAGFHLAPTALYQENLVR